MDKRKIIAFGTNSFVISLPKIWIKNNRLNKGDVVNISLEGSDITISASVRLFHFLISAVEVLNFLDMVQSESPFCT